jgi:transposase-like protein
MAKANFSCSHCGSDRVSATNEGKNVNRGYCTFCLSSTSDTAGTIWHKTHLPPETRTSLTEAYEEGQGVRQAAREIGVNKNTVSKWFSRLNTQNTPDEKA